MIRGEGRLGSSMVQVCVVAVAAFFCVVPAVSPEADTKHVFSSAFGSAGSGVEQFSLVAANFEVEPQIGGSGVVVSQVTGDVYVADTANARVDQFSSSGLFVRAWGWGVADGLAAFETCTIVCQAGIAGSGAGQFRAPTFIAVDDSGGPSGGDVYVGDIGTGMVQKFTAAGVLVSVWGVGGQLSGVSGTRPFGPLAGIAVDAAGDLDVLDRTSEVLFRFLQDGSVKDELPIVRGTLPGGLAIDSKGDFFKVNGDRSVEEFGPAAEVIGQITLTEHLATGATIGIDPANGDLYLDYAGKVVDRYAFDGSGQVIEPGSSACSSFEPETGCQPTESFGSEALTASAGIAVRGSDHGVEVADSGSSAVKLFGFLTVPDVTTNTASSVGVSTVTVNGELNPDGIAVTECVFLYGETEAYGQTAPCSESPAEIGSGSLPVVVHANIEGLSPNTTYHYRLRAANKNGKNSGADQSFITPSPPLVISASTANVTATSADLLAEINPVRAETTYHFEYGPTSSYGTSIPTADVHIGSDEADHSVSQHLQGLQPGTLYHYRVTAHSIFGTTEGPDQSFTTQALSSGGEAMLPDGRAWELVSPPKKYGASILPLASAAISQAAAAGNAVTYAANAPTEANPHGNSNRSQVLSVREPGGWSSQDLATPHIPATGTGCPNTYSFFSDDLVSATVQPCGEFEPSLSPVASEQTLYLRTNFLSGDVNQPCTASCDLPLVTGCPSQGRVCAPSVAEHANVPPGTLFGESHLTPLGVTPDLSHVVFESNDVALDKTPVPAGKGGLYEWVHGVLTLIGIVDKVVTLGTNQATEPFQAISDSGSRVIFNGESEGQSGLLLRDVSRGESVQLDAAESGCLSEGECRSGGSIFQGASGDGSWIFFTSQFRLTKNAGASEGHPDLYECHMVAIAGRLHCQLADLTPPGLFKESTDIAGRVLGIGRDGASVYFAANGKLTAGAVNGNCNAGQAPSEAGAKCNLYVLQRSGIEWGAPRLIAVLSSQDKPDWGASLPRHTARVSPNGGWLTFQSEASLTGYDNRDVMSGKRDEEVYLYREDTGTLVCASCNPSGARPLGIEAVNEAEPPIALPEETWGQQQWIAGSVPGWVPFKGLIALYQPRYLSDSGRLFFNSSDGLVPGAVNHAEDVFEYEPVGVGGCSSSSIGQSVAFFGGESGTFNRGAGGCVGLLSSGGEVGESAFLDANESGGDVFFLTSAKLAAGDTDSSLDVYDAHECSLGSPCLSAPSVLPPPCVSGDSCKGAPSPQPDSFGAPASSTFSGADDASASATSGKPVVKPLTRAEKLARALKVCRRKSKKKRVTCQRQARRQYGPVVVHKVKKRIRGQKSRGRGK